ncbi:anti-sigma factor RsbA family regulatory protein [Actinophytocola sp. KF-1]
MSTASPALRTGTSGDESFVHPALFYRGDAEYLAGTVPFVRDGLEADEPVAVAVPGRNLELLRAEFGADAERVLLLDMTEAGRNPGRIIPGVLRAFADRHRDRPVRIIGEPIWPSRSELEYPACAQHEALINMAFTGRDVTILCPYDEEGLTPRVLADAEATHPVLLDRDGQRDSEAYAPDRIVAAYNQPLPEPASVIEAAEFATPGDITRLRRAVRDHADNAGLAADRVVDMELVVTELLSNSVDHGGGSGTMRLWTDGDHLVCEVRDSGVLTDPLAGRRPTEPGQLRGRGLLLVNHLADLVRIHTGSDGTAIRVHFHA